MYWNIKIWINVKYISNYLNKFYVTVWRSIIDKWKTMCHSYKIMIVDLVSCKNVCVWDKSYG